MTAIGAITAIGDDELNDDDINPHSGSFERARLYAAVDVGLVQDVYPPKSGKVESAWKFIAAEVVKIDEDLGALLQPGVPDLRVFVVIATVAFSLLATEMIVSRKASGVEDWTAHHLGAVLGYEDKFLETSNLLQKINLKA